MPLVFSVVLQMWRGLKALWVVEPAATPPPHVIREPSPELHSAPA